MVEPLLCFSVSRQDIRRSEILGIAVPGPGTPCALGAKRFSARVGLVSPARSRGVVELGSSRGPRGSGTSKDAFKTPQPPAPAARPPRPARQHRLRSGPALTRSPGTERFPRSRCRRARPSPRYGRGAAAPADGGGAPSGGWAASSAARCSFSSFSSDTDLRGRILGLHSTKAAVSSTDSCPAEGEKGRERAPGRAVPGAARRRYLAWAAPPGALPSPPAWRLQHGTSPGATTAPSLHCAAPRPRTPIVPPGACWEW